MDLPGVDAIVTARILGETGDVRRFRDHNAYASANGTAPIPASSGEVTRDRVNPGGNRLLNEAIHTIALVQNRGVGPGKAFIDQRRANGKSHREAMRSLKRRLSDVVYRHLVDDATAGSPGGQVGASLQSSAADLIPMASTSEQSLPGLDCDLTPVAAVVS